MSFISGIKNLNIQGNLPKTNFPNILINKQSAHEVISHANGSICWVLVSEPGFLMVLAHFP